MRTAAVATIVMASALLAGCATRSPAAADDASANVAPSAAHVVDAASAEGRIRCAIIADSVRAATPLANLPMVRPRGRFAMPSPGLGAVQGEVRTIFLVDPTGRAVPGTVVVTGPANASFRQEMEAALTGVAFEPPKVLGCPSWGRGDIRTRARIERRRMD